MKAMSNKAQMNLANLGNIAIALVLAVVIIGVMATILATLQDTQDDNSATRDVNESFTFINGTKQGFTEGTVTSVTVYNETNIATTGFTFTDDGITFTLGEDLNWTTDADGINVTYTYTIGSTARNITLQGQGANLTMASFIPTIAIVAISAIIIGLVLVMFRRRQ